MTNDLLSNYTVDTRTEYSPNVYQHNCYIHLYIEDGIKFEIRCENGHEKEMAVLLASLDSPDCFDYVLGGIDQLANGEEVLNNLAIVFDSLNSKPEEEEENFTPIIHPVSVYNSQQNSSFGEE